MGEVQNSRGAIAIAVQVLRRIYGENPSRWKVSLNVIAAIIDQGLKDDRRQQRELVEAYQQTIEAVDILSKPPLWSERPQGEQLRSMISDRLEAIHALAQRMTQTPASTDVSLYD